MKRYTSVAQLMFSLEPWWKRVAYVWRHRYGRPRRVLTDIALCIGNVTTNEYARLYWDAEKRKMREA